MIAYEREQFWPVFAVEFQGVWASEHRAEVQGPNSQAMLNIDLYASYEDEDRLLVFTARDDGKLIGYIVCLILYDLPFVGEENGHICFYYVRKPYRNQGIAGKLLELLEAMAKDMYNIGKLFVEAKTRLQFADFFRQRGYDDYEICLQKEL